MSNKSIIDLNLLSIYDKTLKQKLNDLNINSVTEIASVKDYVGITNEPNIDLLNKILSENLSLIISDMRNLISSGIYDSNENLLSNINELLEISLYIENYCTSTCKNGIINSTDKEFIISKINLLKTKFNNSGLASNLIAQEITKINNILEYCGQLDLKNVHNNNVRTRVFDNESNISQLTEDLFNTKIDVSHKANIGDSLSDYGIDDAYTKTEIDTTVDILNNLIEVINSKIPSAAQSSNQLADKAFVNSTIQTTTGAFRGTYDLWANVPNVETAYPTDYAGYRKPTTNDYIIIRFIKSQSEYKEDPGYLDDAHTIRAGDTWRFKYTGLWEDDAKNGWVPEYQLNTSSFTMAQLNTINSGMVASDKTKLDTVEANANCYIHPSYTSANSNLYNIKVDEFGHVKSATATTAQNIVSLLGNNKVNWAVKADTDKNGNTIDWTVNGIYTLMKNTPMEYATNIKLTSSNTTKAYITGTTLNSTGYGSLVFDTGVYLDTTSGVLTATKFNGLATKAVSDSDGSQINTTYLKLNGGELSSQANIAWKTSGNGSSNKAYNYGGLYWSGQTDGIKIYACEPGTSDHLDLRIEFTDNGRDNSNALVFRSIDTSSNVSEVAKITNNGDISCNSLSCVNDASCKNLSASGNLSVSGALTVGSISSNSGIAASTIYSTNSNSTTYYLCGTNTTSSGNKSLYHSSLVYINGSTIYATTFNGTATAAKYSDYAEWFPRGENTETGDIIALDETAEDERYIKATKDSTCIVGIESEEYGYSVGGCEVPNGENYREYLKEKYIAVGLAGRVHVKFIGPSKKGGKVVISNIPGVGRLKNSNDPLDIQVLGYLVESDNKDNEVRLLKLKVL